MPRPPRPEVLAFLADVKEDPEDLTPWLVLCDWLEEYGDEVDQARSEFCRLCFDKLGKKTYASDWDKGERRRSLFRQYADRWLGPIQHMQPQREKGLYRIDYARDFDHLMPQLLENEENWAWVYSLNLYASAQDLRSPEYGRLLGTLSDLTLTNLDGDDHLKAVAECSALAHVHRLNLHVHGCSLVGARVLAGSPYLGGVERLVYLPRRGKRSPVLTVLEDRFGDAVDHHR